MKKTYFKTSFGMMNYEYYAENKNQDTLVFLHGWGQSLDTFNSVITKLKDNYNILSVDFLGFGKSELSLSSMSLDDYVENIKDLIKYLQIKNPIFIGHSFGGRVVIKYISKYDYKLAFLVCAPCFKNKSINYYVDIYIYKLKKNFYKIFNKEKYNYLINNSGSDDYKKCSNVMKETFKKIVREDLTEQLKKIKNNVVILSSVNDKEVRYKDQIKMYKTIDNSRFYPFYNSDHFLYIDEENKFLKIIKKEINYEYNV